MKKICVQCKKEFELTDSEIVFYKEKGLSLPKRCKECRDANRKTKAGMNPGRVQKNYNKDITVDTLINKNHKRRSSKAKFARYLIAFLIILMVGIGILFSSLDSLEENPVDNANGAVNVQQSSYNFSNQETLNSHFQKHGHEFGYTTAEQYLQGAIRVIENPSSLQKMEDDGDYVYYLQSTNEIVFVSPGGVIRSYFKPTDGIAYFNRTQVMIFDFEGLINSISYIK